MKYLGALVLALPMVLFQNCAKMQFSQKAVAGSAGEGLGAVTEQCQTSIVESNRKVKVLLLVDASGSNVQDSTTDPKKVWRAAAINDLVNRYGVKSNFYFGLVTFQGTSAKAQIVSGSGQAIFSNQQSDIQDGISRFMDNADGGHTPYKAALAAAKSLIEQDLRNNPSDDALYSVAMISDGAPSDYSSAEQIIPDANELMALAKGRVTLNGVYYYNMSSGASTAKTQYLQNLATIGKGILIVANASQALQVDDLIQVQKEICN